MKIGIKYCGGCNPLFDRRELVERLVTEYSKFSFKPVIANFSYDILIVINGCLRDCANHNDLISNKKIICNTQDDYENLKKILDAASIVKSI